MFSFLSKPISHNYKLRNLVYNYLLRRAGNPTKKWQETWNDVITPNINLPVTTVIHGYKALTTMGFTYPIFMRRFNRFNNPIVQIVHETFSAKGGPVNIIDVGAAIGDTAFLLHANVPGGINKMLCIDGDGEFFNYLKENTRQFNAITCVQTFLSSHETAEKELVRIHAGTASAQGEKTIQAKPLDMVVEETNFTKADVLKIDVDGFDGKVLAGATRLLQQDKPNVIFEWHPILLKQTNNSTYECFDVLQKCGYDHFFFFTKMGDFSHYTFKVTPEAISFLETLCLEGKFGYDWHFDVVALPAGTTINMQSLAVSYFARNKKSRF